MMPSPEPTFPKKPTIRPPENIPGVRSSPDEMRVTIYSRLLLMLGVFATFTSSFYLVLFFSTRIVQALWAAIPILLSVLFIPLVYYLAKKGSILPAGILSLLGVSIAYGVNELLWIGLTPYHIVGGSLLIILTGVLVLPRERRVWLIAIGLYLLYIILVDRFHPFVRINVTQLSGLLPYAIGTNILLILTLAALATRSLRTRSIRTRLLITFILLVLTPVILSLITSSILNAQNAQQRANGQLEMSTYQTFGVNMGVVVLAALFTLGAGWYAAQGITDPLSNLSKTAKAIAAGELTLRAKVDQEDEVGELAKSFNSMTDQLRFLLEGLEQRVTERTKDVERRSIQLQVASEVARETTATRDLNELLNRAVNLVSENFGFYHTGIFLIDEQDQYAILRAATGDAGQQMLHDGHKLVVSQGDSKDQQGLVSFVSWSGVARIASDIEADFVHIKNPLLPDTRSEVALPLKVGNHVIGVLDVQSKDEGAINDDDVRILQTLADQLAVAIENARLFQEMSQTVRELETVYGQYTRDAWSSLKGQTPETRGKPVSDYRYRGLAIETTQEPHAEASEALRLGRTVVKSELDQSALAIPLQLRGQTIGVVSLRFEGQELPAEAISTYEEIANRLVLVLENARLLQEAQQLAKREQRINVITTQIRSSPTTDSILRNTVREVGNALGASRTFIQLGIQTGKTGNNTQPPSAPGPVKTNGDNKEHQE